ncbi:MAG: bifunctional phosphopantothenoylcysteine decarboxylase/phosphopantothenate--cysteine ligase CoaBC [Actinomycetota bacterium]|nr:bifunctional phosphopantothenoylcysteine decarboxylase/phosphopantothenate--cysteine ligase CoaBC [Actinomycetota bacterium]
MGHIVLGITGGIAAYKAVEVARQLILLGHMVKVVMTENATRLVSPVTFGAITGNPVALELFEGPHGSMKHISLSREAELVVVAPATANILAKMASGLADDLLSTTLLATKAPILVAPAMNSNMYNHPATLSNIRELESRGVHVLGPASGSLACGEEGSGRMVEPDEIVESALRIMGMTRRLRGRKVLVTAGGTREPIDPVRFIGNRSSGRMGYALAEIAVNMGADVILVSGPTGLQAPKGVELIDVLRAEEMREEVVRLAKDCDVIVMAAAVADFTPSEVSRHKVKKDNIEELDLRLTRTRDILAELGKMKQKDQVLVGFAAETKEIEEHARRKMKAKKVDIMVANDVSSDDAGFASDYNRATIFFSDGGEMELDLIPKRDLARIIWEAAADLMG